MSGPNPSEGRIPVIPTELLARPIDFVHADHHRQRLVCGLLDELAGQDPVDAALCAELLDHLTNSLPQHMADEEEDLFPLLRRRCAPEDEIEEVLGLLSLEHARDEALAAEVVRGLRLLAANADLRHERRFLHALGQFTETQRRHLAWENGLILPLARRRLTDADKTEISRRMAARRGLRLSE